MYGLIGLGLFLLVWAVLSLTDNLLQIEAKKQGADTSKGEYSLYPSLKGFFSTKAPSFADSNSFFALKEGFDIKLAGGITDSKIQNVVGSRFAVRPPDYRGIAPIPKLLVQVGDEVKAGDGIFFDKSNPEIKHVAPVSGEIVEIRRGAKRAITEVVILADKEQQSRSFDIPGDDSSREDIVNLLMESGLWASINQRPFDIIPGKDDVPKNIFISTFNTAPLALDESIVVEGKEQEFQKGLDVLGKLTQGNIYLGLDGRKEGASPSAFVNAEGVVKNWFSGAHPAGNVGVQIHHVDPINPGDNVWTLKVQDVIRIGNLFLTGTYNAEKIMAIVGAEIDNPRLIKTYIGASISDLVDTGNSSARIINGDVLTGRKLNNEDFVSSNSDMVTVVKEGDYYEIFGWLIPIKPRPTISKTFPNFLFPNHKFVADTNMHGEKRAFVVTGQYESVMPMNIYPQHLMKAIMTNDYERMEGLGLIELSEEDVALCEFVCTSKMPLQKILREGLEMMQEQS